MSKAINKVISTPWGPSQYELEYAPGILFYGTAGRGGFKLHPVLNALIPEKWRLRGRFTGWYEEDCGFAPIMATFPLALSDRIKITKKELNGVLEMWEEWVRDLNSKL